VRHHHQNEILVRITGRLHIHALHGSVANLAGGGIPGIWTPVG
jgi:hypothetical protein